MEGHMADPKIIESDPDDAELGLPGAGKVESQEYHPPNGKWYGECLTCAYGGPADTGDPFRWPIPADRVTVLRGKGGVVAGYRNTLRCPKCKGADTGVFIPRGRVLDQLNHRQLVEENANLRKQLESLMARDTAAGKPLVPAVSKSKVERPTKEDLRGQHGG